MANYSLVIGSKYSPFTFDELLKPALLATEAHREIEEQYSELAAKSNVWEEIANEQTDPYAYGMYKKYSNDLKNQADILATQGLTPGSRKALLDMKGRYSKEITPIETAYTRRRELANEQREALLKDNTMMYDIDASTLSLDDLIKNPELSYRNYSGAVLANQVGTAAKALAKDIKQNHRKWKEVLDGQYYETMMQKGYTPEQVLLASMGDPNAPKDLVKIVEQAIDSSGIKSWEDKNALKQAYDYARQGLWESIGDTTYQIQSNKKYDYDMEEAAQIRKEARALAAKQQEMLFKHQLEQQGQLNDNLLAINPLNIYSSKEQEKAAQNIKNYSKYFTKDAKGKTILTDEGREEYLREVKENQPIPSGGPNPAYMIKGGGTTDFRKFMDSIGVDPNTVKIDNWNSRAIGNSWDKYVNDNDTALYDASKVTEYNSLIDSEDRKAAKDAILQGIRGIEGGLKEVDYDPKSGTFVPTGESLTVDNLNSKDYEVISTNMSAYGSTVMIRDKKGNVRRFEMPSINPYMESFRDNELATVASIQQQLLADDLTDEEKAALINEYKIALNSARLYDSQLFLTNKTKPQEFKPYAF